jgi:hypothetical protein
MTKTATDVKIRPRSLAGKGGTGETGSPGVVPPESPSPTPDEGGGTWKISSGATRKKIPIARWMHGSNEKRYPVPART